MHGECVVICTSCTVDPDCTHEDLKDQYGNAVGPGSIRHTLWDKLMRFGRMMTELRVWWQNDYERPSMLFELYYGNGKCERWRSDGHIVGKGDDTKFVVVYALLDDTLGRKPTKIERPSDDNHNIWHYNPIFP
ncbi:MAG: hypothetical protein CMI52_00320 [Parcubacteria group bacterium]|nr:hypothetical protein [Parcubacteria group bacterium]|tara:strand:- start:942 stop:1340 length:399 start_codon:yes stop_codon:yes gene_type:complete